MLRTPPQLFEDFESGAITREQLHSAMAFHARGLIEEVIEAHENPLAAWWEGLLARKVASRLAARHGEKRVRQVLGALAEVPDFFPAQWLWNASHPDVPLFCFLRLRREPVFRILKIESALGTVEVVVEYGAGAKGAANRERFLLRHRPLGGLEVVDRDPSP